MDDNNRNFFMAIILSICVLIAWQFFYAGPKLQKEQERRERMAKLEANALRQENPGLAPKAPAPLAVPGGAPQAERQSTAPGQAQSATGKGPSFTPNIAMNRENALKNNVRLNIETARLRGSISLKGARLDDLILQSYRETVDPESGNVVFLSPSGSYNPYYVEYGWVSSGTKPLKLPGQETLWENEGTNSLTPMTPVRLKYDNGEGLIFRRTLSIDENYMFTVRQEVENQSQAAVTLLPYALLSRHGKPQTQGFFILHEGLIGVLEGDGLQEIDYDEALDNQSINFRQTKGWLGITDKYWAAALIPDQGSYFNARFQGINKNDKKFFQVDYLLNPIVFEPGARHEVTGYLFAGAKENHLIDRYRDDLKIKNFDLLIDWGWFYFLTKPFFYALDYFYKLVGNFGLSILIVTVLIKLVMFPLANKSYVSMGKMKKLQPDMQKIKERFKDDKVRQQQALMDLYKKEKINPMSGCLPILIQIPVFFALYKVLFVTIEMRHAPFFGWVKDLSAPDPTSLFNLFGLIPWDPPTILMIGVWPLIMGATMWVQMQLNPQQPDPIQQKIFTWMPVFFTFLLASFPAGLVIYWAWNNILSILQQSVIMSRQNVKIELFENLNLHKLNKLWRKKSSSS